jgi:hypothetical protein
VDVELWVLAPMTVLDGDPNATTDGGESQILLRFEAIIGQRENQIPPCSAASKDRAGRPA